MRVTLVAFSIAYILVVYALQPDSKGLSRPQETPFGLLDADYDLFEQSYIPQKNHTIFPIIVSKRATEESAEIQLKWLYYVLQTISRKKPFDYGWFDQYAREIKERVGLTKKLMRMNSATNNDFGQQLHFVDLVALKMAEASEFLKIFRANGPGNQFVRGLINLNVSLFGYFDPQGVPDPEIEGFHDTVTRASKVVESLHELFDNVRKVPICVSLIFQIQLADVRQNIDVLRSYIPEITVDPAETPEVSTKNLQVSTENLEGTTGDLGATIGDLEETTGHLEGTTENMEVSTEDSEVLFEDPMLTRNSTEKTVSTSPR